MMNRFVLGSATVGAKGQIVLPVNVRKAFNIVPGETLIVMSSPGRGGHGIMLLKTSSLAHMLEHIEQTGKTIRSLVKAQGTGRTAHGTAGKAPGRKGARRGP